MHVLLKGSFPFQDDTVIFHATCILTVLTLQTVKQNFTKHSKTVCSPQKWKSENYSMWQIQAKHK